ncbi:MAG: OmpA family protein [Bacteroidota bacterium]
MIHYSCSALYALLVSGIIAALMPPCIHAQDPASSTERDQDEEVVFPMGDRSFADAIRERTVGNPDGGSFSERPEALIGPPRFQEDGTDAVYTLGCGGSVVVAFTENTLIDIPGRDLYIFEVGRDIEAIAVAVSEDAQSWTRIGIVSGGNASIDIGPFTPAGANYRYVKLVDLKEVCDGRTPGADVDAIGAIGTAARVQVESAVLFDTDDHTLKEEAFPMLDEVAARISDSTQTQINVLGHTDSTGSASYNQELSERRAETVARYLEQSMGDRNARIVPRGYGETRPIASNHTAEGRSRNRRVTFTMRTMHTAWAANDTTGIQREVLGVWKTTDHGMLEMQRTLDTGQVEGTYIEQDRSIHGEFVSDTVFEGTWVAPEPSGSSRECLSHNDGHRHWGRIRIEFDSPNRNSFTGHYGYCYDSPDEIAFEGEREI